MAVDIHRSARENAWKWNRVLFSIFINKVPERSFVLSFSTVPHTFHFTTCLKAALPLGFLQQHIYRLETLSPWKLPYYGHRETGHKGEDALPAMQAVMKQAVVPETRALTAPEVMSRFLEGAMDARKHGRKHERLMLTRIPNSSLWELFWGWGLRSTNLKTHTHNT